jgi:hypothetical protein
MGYPELRRSAKSLKILTNGWDKCPLVELGLRIRAIALYAARNDLPQDVYITYTKMRKRWDEEKPQLKTRKP